MNKQHESILDNTEKSSSTLTYAVNLQNQAAKIGFDWPNIQPVFDKLAEEIAELKAEIVDYENIKKIEEEFGDLLFVCTNLAQHLKVDPEVALAKANLKFEKRFREMEQKIKEQYSEDSQINLDRMDEIWEKVKIQEKIKVDYNKYPV